MARRVQDVKQEQEQIFNLVRPHNIKKYKHNTIHFDDTGSSSLVATAAVLILWPNQLTISG